MRLGSGRERRRCIMQFSLAGGSESAGGVKTMLERAEEHTSQSSLCCRNSWTAKFNLALGAFQCREKGSLIPPWATPTLSQFFFFFKSLMELLGDITLSFLGKGGNNSGAH